MESHLARAVIGAPNINLTEASWRIMLRGRLGFKTRSELVQTTHRDGIVFDYESSLPKGSVEGEVYAKLIADTRTIFHQVNPSYQISTRVPETSHFVK